MVFIHSRHTLILLTMLCTTALPAIAEADKRPGTTDCLQLNEQPLMDDLSTLASDTFAGRKPGTPGHAKATGYLVKRFGEIGLQAFNNSFIQTFTFDGGKQGKNVVGYLRGEQEAERYLVITAHYDHLGSQGSRIFNGADDNASGVATLLTVAAHYQLSPPNHSILFVATDAEEPGLFGAQAFMRELPVPQSSIELNINIDMIGQGGFGDELFLVHDGKHQKNQDVLAKVRAGAEDQSIRLSLRNARSRLSRLTKGKRTDWHDASDYAVFGKYSIPFVHIGTATHQDYHTSADIVANIDRRFFVSSAGIAGCIIAAFDSQRD